MEYASSVWDPHLKKHVKQIEGVQRRAARFLKNCYTREPGTVTNLLNELNWIPLKERRTISRLTLFHKAIHGDGGLAFLDYVTKRRRHLRNSSQNKFIEPLRNTETYKNSYFCIFYIILMWSLIIWTDSITLREHASRDWERVS